MFIIYVVAHMASLADADLFHFHPPSPFLCIRRPQYDFFYKVYCAGGREVKRLASI
jgi:hypothetical protein